MPPAARQQLFGKRRMHERLEYREKCSLRAAGKSFTGRGMNISEGGIAVEIRSIGSLDSGMEVALYLQNFPPIAAQVRWTRNRVVGLEFVEPLDRHPEIRQLIHRLATGEGALISPADL